jgi:cytochrome c556
LPAGWRKQGTDHADGGGPQSAICAQASDVRYKNDPTIAQQHKDFETAMTKLKKDMETVVARLQKQDGRIQE